MDSFLANAEELELKGLSDQTFSDLLGEEKKPEITKPVKKIKELFVTSTKYSADPVPNVTTDEEKISRATAIPNLEALDVKVKSLMEKSKNCVPNGTQANGTPKQVMAFIYKVCGKEGVSNAVGNHIEANHLEGISLPCAKCGKVFTSRN